MHLKIWKRSSGKSGRLIITNKWTMSTSSKKGKKKKKNKQTNKGAAPSKVSIQTNPFPVLSNQEAGWSFKLQIKVWRGAHKT